MGIARLLLLVAGILWVMSWSGHKAYGQETVGLTLNGVSYPNHGIVDIMEIGTGSEALHCTTTLPGCCFSFNGGGWFLPNGNAIPNSPSLPYYRTRTQNPGALLLNRNPEATTTGIFRCYAPVSGGTQSLYVGVYTSTTGTPNATSLVYSETTRSLTCTSTGGPATTVTWTKNGTMITLNGAYQQTQVVTDPVTGTYQTVLTIAQSVTDVFGTYSCTVGNTRGTSTAIETTVSSLLQVSITSEANPTAGQSYTFTCTVTPQGGLTGIPTVQWSRLGSPDPITTGGDFTVSSTPSYTLTINPLQQSHDGQYVCQATIGATTRSSSAPLTVAAPSLSVAITPAGTKMAGQSYSLSCSVSGADSLSPTFTTYRWYNESTNPRSQVGTTSTYTLSPLRPYHAGECTCEVNITSPYLNGVFSQSMMQDITVQIPVPTVTVFPLQVTSAYAGSQLTLTCSIGLDSTLFPLLGDLVVTGVWSHPGGGMLSRDGRVTVSPPSQQGITTTFTSTVMFNTLRTSDAGTYTCEVTVTPRGSTVGTVTNGVGSANVAITTITNPTIQVDLIFNTTRFPNTAPYNAFSLTCTATVPQGVVSPKTFTWRRRIGASTSGLNDITDNSSIVITSTNLDQPTSTSVLTVRETTAGDYRYRCRVDLSELLVVNTADVYPINVTGPANPVQPQNLMNISTRHDRATVQWSVSYIAYTPETYTVNYGRAMTSLGMSVTATQRGDNFIIPSLPFMFSAELTGLSPGVTYYYQVEARNSEGPTLSAVQQFTSAEQSPTPPRMFRITAVTTTSLSFSWQDPTNPNGVITTYQLSCHPLLLGIPTPEHLSPGPTARMAVLANLHPGVTYNCSILAENRDGQSNLVYAVGNTQETAPNGPPQSFTVTPSTGARNVTFSWSLPAPTLRNGIITGYSLSCVPEGGRESTVSMHYTQSGTFTLEGFAPATTYNCSISASNSEGSGPVAYKMVATMDDAILFQLRLSDLSACQEWVVVATRAKLTDIIDEVVQNTEQLCLCGFGVQHITEEAFQCFANSEQQVTFRAILHGTAQATSSQLLRNIETWVAQTDTTIAIQGVRLHVDRSCLITISTFGDPECATVVPTSNSDDGTFTAEPAQSNNTGAIVGGVVTVLVVIILAVTVIVIAVLVIKNRKAGFSDMGKEKTKSSGAGIVVTNLRNLGHNSENLCTSETRRQSHESEISTTPCPAYVPTSHQGSGTVEEPEYEQI